MRVAPQAARPARKTRFSMRTILCILATFAVAGLTACGQVGPLYLPEPLKAPAPAGKADPRPADPSEQFSTP